MNWERTLVHDYLTLYLPEGWTDASQVIALGRAEGGFRPNIVFSQEPTKNFETVEEFAARQLLQLKEALARYELLEQGAITFGQLPGYLRQHAFKMDKGWIGQLQFYHVRDGRCYTFTLTHLKEHLHTLKPIAEELLSRLQLTPPKDLPVVIDEPVEKAQEVEPEPVEIEDTQAFGVFLSERIRDPKHYEILRASVKQWNEWRIENKNIVPDLSELDLSGLDLVGVDLQYVDLRGTNLTGTNLSEANCSHADFRGAKAEGIECTGSNFYRTVLDGADFSRANLTNANLRETTLDGTILTDACLNSCGLINARVDRTWMVNADLRSAVCAQSIFSSANLSGVNLSEAALYGCVVMNCRFDKATLNHCYVYGSSIWNSSFEGATQRDIVITESKPDITVDNVEVAQMIYLILNNSKLRTVVDTLTSKIVLILGRFTPERKRTLDALKDALRAKNYLPVLFDFERPATRDFTETVSILAHLARFVVADLTDPASVPQELTTIIPRLLSVPIRPLLFGDASGWTMFSDFLRYPQVIAPLHYADDLSLISMVDSEVIAPAEAKVRDLIPMPVGNLFRTISPS